MKHKSLRWLSGSVLLLLLPALVSAQTQKRMIVWLDYRAPAASTLEAIELIGITAEKEPETIGKPFDASDEWLKGLTFRVKNISGSPIRDLWIAVLFPEVVYSDGIRSGTLSLSLFNPDLHKNVSSPAARPLMPMEEIDLVLTEGQYKMIMRSSGAARIKIPSLTVVQLRLNVMVKFENAAEVFCSFPRIKP